MKKIKTIKRTSNKNVTLSLGACFKIYATSAMTFIEWNINIIITVQQQYIHLEWPKDAL